MLKPPIILPIVPSRLWQLTQCCLFMVIAMLGYWVGGKLAALALIVLGVALGWRAYLYQPEGLLSLTSTASVFHGRWLLTRNRKSVGSGPMLSEEVGEKLNEELGEEHQVRCDYLGPWLIGLYIGKQRVWLWPDSAPSESLREVRQLFHRPGR
ncbi:hypothetical protein [Vreelandella sulfidaeris]|uniref:Toxin CptA n=1 Tax=Vreelandella sulfidaeris TaxID=115553 RepID=A0A455U9K0_9GAMM|nr:hypothetical protein HSBAA_41720 [Halomonas sulfidaeris]